MKYKNACTNCFVYYPNLKQKTCPNCNSALRDVEGMPGEYEIEMTMQGSDHNDFRKDFEANNFDDVFDSAPYEKYEKW